MRQILRGGAVVSAGLAVEYGAQMLRILLLARILGPVEFGIVVSLNALYGVVTMSTFIGVERFLIHAQDGGSRELLAVSHTLSILKGVLGAIVMVLLAWPTALLLGVPYALGSFMALALVPLLAGPTHMGVQQVQRCHVFWPDAAATIGANAVGLAVSVIAAFILRDHRALVWGLCATAACYTIGTHLLAKGAYRLSFSRIDLGRAFRFGAPLMLNGLSLAVLGQLDRIVVGALLGVAELGRYGLATTLVLTPISLIFRVGTSIFQPHLATAWHATTQAPIRLLYRRMTTGLALVGTILAVGVCALGNIVLPWVFGSNFAVGDLFMSILGATTLARFAKGAANLGGLSIGRTMDLMMSNAVGAVGLPLIALGLLWLPTLNTAAVGYLASDLMAMVFIAVRLGRYFRGPGDASPYLGFLAALPVIGGVMLWVWLVDPTWQARAIFVAVFTAMCGGIAWRMVARMRPNDATSVLSS